MTFTKIQLLFLMLGTIATTHLVQRYVIFTETESKECIICQEKMRQMEERRKKFFQGKKPILGNGKSW